MLTKDTIFAVIGTAAFVSADTYKVPANPSNTGEPFDGFVSYSIEFSSFPDFAGNKSHPNDYSYTLIKNLEKVGGAKPYFRVGGNTQDFALYDASQKEGLVGIVNPDHSPDYPTTITIGKAYFESYRTWPGVQYSHGFNLGLGAKTAQGWQTLVDTVPLACEALSGGRLYTWEYGNEPDIFDSGKYAPRDPATWNEEEYVSEWLNGTAEIKKQVAKHCPKLAAHGRPYFIAPSFTNVNKNFRADKVFADGLDKRGDVEMFSTHNYISGAKSPGVTLQGTLMNHTRTKQSVDAHIAEYNGIFDGEKNPPPIIFGEHNSLYNQGRPGLSNTFGAALWGVDFNLYSASVGVKRVHMHQGTNYRYQAWQPIMTDLATKGTKPPYYGSIAVAAMTRRVSSRRPVTISSIPLSSDAQEAAYAAHYSASRGRSQLARILVLNMHGYNTTVDGAGLEPLPNPEKRQVRSYKFDVDGVRDGLKVNVHRLMANGSDAITGITYDGWSYNWELEQGKPVRLHNVTVGETATVHNGQVAVDVPDSSAVLLSFGRDC